NSAEITSAILRDTPPHVVAIRPDLPRDVDRIVSRCLEKEPRDRFQTARDVYNELRYLARDVAPSGAWSAAIPASGAMTAATPGSGAHATAPETGSTS